jgi:hypothetical protein
MAVANIFDSVFDDSDCPFPKTAAVLSDRELAELMELEFSEIGRDPKFLPGWYILPAIVGGLLVLTALIV